MVVGIMAFLFIRFTSLITPLLMVFILAYLLHPVATMISFWLRVSWRAAVNILLRYPHPPRLADAGRLAVGQVQSLIQLIQTIVADLPRYVEALSGQVFQIGPFRLDMRTIDLNAISSQLLSYVQPLLGRTGNLVTAVAGGAAEIFGWTFFVLIVSYFLMVESSGLQSDLIKVEVPGYNEDLRKLGSKLSMIWNSFPRGQIFIFAMSALIYIVVLSVFGVRYAIGIASRPGKIPAIHRSRDHLGHYGACDLFPESYAFPHGTALLHADGRDHHDRDRLDHRQSGSPTHHGPNAASAPGRRTGDCHHRVSCLAF